MKDLTNLTREEIRQYRDSLIATYIGEWLKPQSYYDELTEINEKLRTLE